MTDIRRSYNHKGVTWAFTGRVSKGSGLRTGTESDESVDTALPVDSSGTVEKRPFSLVWGRVSVQTRRDEAKDPKP